jgi:capsular exopolysaccharide synthesis family protein
LSTREEALRKAKEQKEEARARSRGDALRQLVEDAVRKAVGGDLKTEQDQAFRRPHVPHEGTPYAERIAPIESVRPSHSLMWAKEVNSIAADIKMKIGKGKRGTIMVVSSVSGEGTTTISLNISRALAKISSGNVLLLDCNYRHPEIHEIFGIEASPGFTDILAGKVSWEEAVRESTLKNFFLLPFGQALEEPLALIGSGRMEELLKGLESDFEYIFLDTPPILVSAEAEMIVSWVEAAVLVIKAQATHRKMVMGAVERIVQHKDFLGVIFNQQRFNPSRFRRRD